MRRHPKPQSRTSLEAPDVYRLLAPGQILLPLAITVQKIDLTIYPSNGTPKVGILKDGEFDHTKPNGLGLKALGVPKLKAAIADAVPSHFHEPVSVEPNQVRIIRSSGLLEIILKPSEELQTERNCATDALDELIGVSQRWVDRSLPKMIIGLVHTNCTSDILTDLVKCIPPSLVLAPGIIDPQDA